MDELGKATQWRRGGGGLRRVSGGESADAFPHPLSSPSPRATCSELLAARLAIRFNDDYVCPSSHSLTTIPCRNLLHPTLGDFTTTRNITIPVIMSSRRSIGQPGQNRTHLSDHSLHANPNRLSTIRTTTYFIRRPAMSPVAESFVGYPSFSPPFLSWSLASNPCHSRQSLEVVHRIDMVLP